MEEDYRYMNVTYLQIRIILWTIIGISTLIFAALDNDHRIPIFSYFLCWIALILELLSEMIK